MKRAVLAIALLAASVFGAPWRFPLKKGERGVAFSPLPDWGREGFAAEVWCKPATTKCGYAILVRHGFGFPCLNLDKDFDLYLFNAQNKNVGARIYTPLAPGEWHHYVLSCDKEKAVFYRDGKAMRTIKGDVIPKYDKTHRLMVGNSLGWQKNFEGEIGMIRLYKRPLAAAEVNENLSLLRATKPLPARDGMIFDEERRDLPIENAGKPVTVTLDNKSLDRVRYPRSRHLVGKTDTGTPLVDFEDIAGWTVTVPAGAVKARITRSGEVPLWGDYVLRTEFVQGPKPLAGAEAVLAPPKPIRIDHDFDSIDIWRFATDYSSAKRPKLRYFVDYRTPDGKVHTTGDMGGFLEFGWGIHHIPLKETVKAGAEFVAIRFTGFEDTTRIYYFDNLRFYLRSKKPLPADARVPSWKELGVPTRPETILPTPAAPAKAKTLTAEGARKWRFRSVDAKGTATEFTVEAKTGTLGDIAATFGGRTFRPMQGGGFHWARNAEFPAKAGDLVAPGSPEVKAELTGSRIDGKALVLEWRYSLPGGRTVAAAWRLEQMEGALSVELTGGEGAVGEVQVGAITGIKGRVVELPYLNLGRWFHASYPPGIFCADGLYASVFLDWYNSDASGLFGKSSAQENGHYELNAATADHRWVEDKGAAAKTDAVRDFSVVNGGSYYWPTTAGKRNPVRERIFVTVGPRLDTVLPNIPNPVRPTVRETVDDVWVTRMWYVPRLPFPEYFQREFSMWKLCRDYGMERLNVRHHGDINRMYTPYRCGNPATFIDPDVDFCEPGIGGDAALAIYVKAMQSLGFRLGLYTDHMLLSQFSRALWDEDMLNLHPDSHWIYSSGMSKQTKISRLVAAQKRYNADMRRKFAPNCAYLDQITCPPMWRYTDYDARAPEAAKFSAAYRVFVESLRQEEKDFGPVLSEGKTQMFFAGLCDSYAQPQRMKMPLVPDFNLRKIHPMSVDCGYELTALNWKGAGVKPEVGIYNALVYEYAYGSTGHLFGVYHGEPYDKTMPKFMLLSYFMIQPLQRCFALVPIRAIEYQVNGKLAPIEAAIAAGTLKQNQVKLTYSNGFEVAVNLNEQQQAFPVAVCGRRFDLPSSGFAAAMPDGSHQVYSVLRNGRRADFMHSPALEYRDGEVPEAAVQAKHAYLLKRCESRLTLTPCPFEEAETVTLALGKCAGWEKCAKVRVQAETQVGKAIGAPVECTVAGGRITLPVDGKAFRYVITR